MNKREWLEQAVKHAKSYGFGKFILYVNDEETAIILRGFKTSDSDPIHERVVHRIRTQVVDSYTSRRMRLIEAMTKYQNYLDGIK